MSFEFLLSYVLPDDIYIEYFLMDSGRITQNWQ